MNDERRRLIRTYEEDRNSWEDLPPSGKWQVLNDLLDEMDALEEAKEEIDGLEDDVQEARLEGLELFLPVIHELHGGLECDPRLCQAKICSDARKLAGLKG